VEALIKEKKEKENVLLDLELVNLKNVSLFNYEELKRIEKAEKEKLVEVNKEYQRYLQHLHAQLEIVNEHRKSLDLVDVKERLEDYEQMLQYYILMRTMNKMKDFDVESKEWWEVVKGYFIKELEKNLAQHKANERSLKYRLEIHQNVFLEFACGNPISTETLGQDEKTEVGPNGTSQEEEVQTKEPHKLKGRGQEEKEP
jgi:hypothetical protein